MSQATTLFTLTQLAEVSYTRFQPSAIGDAEDLRLNIQSATPRVRVKLFCAVPT